MIVRYTHVIDVEVEDYRRLDYVPLPCVLAEDFPRDLIRAERASLEIVRSIHEEPPELIYREPPEAT